MSSQEEPAEVAPLTHVIPQPAPDRNRQSVRAFHWWLSQYKELVAAIRFLKTIPIPGSAQLFRTDSAEPHLIIGSAYFPLVGLLVGACLCLCVWLLGPFLPPFALAAVLVVVQVLLTGGLHLDGLMDTCDGLFGGSSRERKLEIMRDSRVGSFGVLAAACLLLLRYTFFASFSPHVLWIALLLIGPVARWTMVLAMRIYPSARQTGLGAAVQQTVTDRRVIVAGLLSLGCVLLVGRLIGLGVWITGSITALLIGLWVTRKLGGLTGDIYGAIEEITEVTCLFLLLLFRNQV